jgi:hypothetical protein
MRASVIEDERLYNRKLYSLEVFNVLCDEVIAILTYDINILDGEVGNVIEVHTCAAEELCVVSHSRLIGLGICSIGEGDVLECNALDGRFGKTVAIASGYGAILANHISEYEGAEPWSSVVNEELLSRPNILCVSIGVAAVIPHIDNDGGEDVVHLDILEENAVDNCVLASATTSLDTKAAVGAIEKALINCKVGYATCHFTTKSDGAVTKLHKAVTDGVAICRGLKLSAKLDLGGFYSDTVIAYAEFTTNDVHYIASLGVEGIGIWAILWGINFKVDELKIS